MEIRLFGAMTVVTPAGTFSASELAE